jgi:serine beta-lactamase-like protein LACTB
MSRSPKQIWLTAIGVAVGVLFAAGLGVYAFIMATTPTLHPNPQDVPSVSHAAPSPEWTEAVKKGQQVARAGLVQQNLPGLSVAVGAGGNIVWAEGFGWADVEKRVPVAPGMRFRIGHASKALTSAAVGLLLEKGRLHVDDEIQKYVPAFPQKEWPVTLRQLMGHVAGVRHYRDREYGDTPSAHCEQALEGLPAFANAPLLFEPETQSRYSTYGWVLVSAAVEAAAAEPFFTFMRRQIFETLGMSDTTSDFETEPSPDRATPYYRRRLTGALTATADYSCFAGAGAFLSTPSDLVRFGLALNSGKLLKPATVDKLLRRQVLASGEETEFGLGWTIETVPLAGEPTRMASHGSRTLLGGSTSFMTFPERGIVVAITSNRSSASTRSMALQIAEAFASVSVTAVPPRRDN